MKLKPLHFPYNNTFLKQDEHLCNTTISVNTIHILNIKQQYTTLTRIHKARINT